MSNNLKAVLILSYVVLYFGAWFAMMMFALSWFIDKNPEDVLSAIVIGVVLSRLPTPGVRNNA